MKNTLLISALSATLALSSCVSHKMGDGNVARTDIRLEQANYRVIATQVKGESIGFHINIREETGGRNYLIFSRPKTTVTADVIEFIR